MKKKGGGRSASSASFDFTLFWTLPQEWKCTVVSLPKHPIISDHTLKLKISKSNPFVSLICLLMSNYSPEMSQMRINCCCAFCRLGRECLHEYNFYSFFQSSDIVASQHSFGTWVFEGKKEGMLQNRHWASQQVELWVIVSSSLGGRKSWF